MRIEDLTPEQKAQLMQELAEKQAKEAEQKKANKQAYKKMAEEFVLDNISSLLSHREATEVIIKRLFDEHSSILEIKKEAFSTKVEEQESHTYTLSDGSASITIGYNISIGFDGSESEGVKKIKDYLLSLDDNSERVRKYRKMVNIFLRPNSKTGQLNPAKIIELSTLKEEFNNTDFTEGLNIIIEAQIKRRSSMYIQGYKMVRADGEPPKKIKFRFSI